MAYTKIIKVKSNLNLCLDYTSNPKKTERRNAEDLNRLLNYTQNSDKTEHQLYVSGFNCIPQNAYEIMMETKIRWRKPVKDGNILAYHIIQSFSPGEATPDQVHQIGCEFAQRFLADRFECTVSTHLDRGHLHNHIVVNSVSYKDGKMFRSDFDAYYKGIRKISDELCRENRLSVIETDGKGKSYAEWISGQTGKPTIRGMVRKDVEQAIVAADSFDGFILELQNMGYTVKYGPRVEHMAVRHKNAQRNVRIDWLDPRFSESALREYYRQLHRMPAEMQQEYRQENAPAKPQWQPTELQPTVRRARYRGKLPRRYSKVSGFMACYYHYCALLRKAYHGKATKRCYFLLREDFLQFNRYQRQTKLLWEHHIETMDDLLAYKENAEVQIQQLARQRKILYRQKREPERAAREEKIKALTQQMKALRHEVYICSDIEADAAEVQEKLRQAELATQEERNEVKQDEQWRRSSRSDVDMSNRLICFNIQSLGEQLKPVAMLSMLEYINTAVMSNERNDPKAATWVYFDEIYLLLRDSLSANFLYTSWKRFRKYNAYATGITQNVQDCLTNDTAYAMLANSEFVVMLRQTKDIDSVVELYGLSEPQRKYLLLAQPGEGIIKMGNSLIPFNNPQPKDTKTYKLLTTKPGEME